MTGNVTGRLFVCILLASVFQGCRTFRRKMEALEGQNVSLPCVVDKQPDVFHIESIEWRKNLNDLKSKVALYSDRMGQKQFWENVTLEAIRNGTQLIGVNLNVPWVTKWDGGVFICDAATFPLGSIRMEIELIIKDQVTVPSHAQPSTTDTTQSAEDTKKSTMNPTVTTIEQLITLNASSQISVTPITSGRLNPSQSDRPDTVYGTTPEEARNESELHTSRQDLTASSSPEWPMSTLDDLEKADTTPTWRTISRRTVIEDKVHVNQNKDAKRSHQFLLLFLIPLLLLMAVAGFLCRRRLRKKRLDMPPPFKPPPPPVKYTAPRYTETL